MIRESYNIGFKKDFRTAYYVLYSLGLEVCFWLAFNLYKQKAFLSTASSYNSAHITSIFMGFIGIALLVIHSSVISALLIDEKKISMIEGVSTSNIKKYLLLESFPMLASFVGIIIGFFISILVVFLINLYVGIPASIVFEPLPIFLSVFVPVFGFSVQSLFRFLEYFSDKMIDKIIFHIFVALGTLTIVLYIFSSASIIVHALFIFFLLFTITIFAYELVNTIYISNNAKKMKFSNFSKIVSKSFITRKIILKNVIGIVVFFIGLTVLRSSLDLKKRYDSVFKFDYVVEEIEDLNETMNYLSNNFGISQIKLSEKKTLYLNNDILDFYVTDLLSLESFYDYNITKSDHIPSSNSIFLPSTYQNKYEIGDSVTVYIDGTSFSLIVSGFLVEQVNGIAYTSNIVGLEYNEYEKILVKTTENVDLKQEVESNVHASVNTREDSFIEDDRLVNRLTGFSIVFFLVIVLIFMFNYIIDRMRVYKDSKDILRSLYYLPVYNSFTNGLILSNNIISLFVSLFIYVIYAFLLDPFIDIVFNNFYLLSFNSLSLMEQMTFVLVIFTIYIIMLFSEYLFYRNNERNFT